MPAEDRRSDPLPRSVLEQNTTDGSATGISSDSGECACHRTSGQHKLGCLEILVVFSWEKLRKRCSLVCFKHASDTTGNEVVSQEKRNCKSHIYHPTSSLL